MFEDAKGIGAVVVVMVW